MLIILPVIITASTVLPRFYSVNADSKIVGGLPINIEQTPYQISLQDRGFHICGGSIIAHNFVLTAAHCTDGNIARNLKIRAGSNYFRVGGELIQVKTIYQHELFDNEIIDYDFAILELLSELTFSLKIRPVELPQQNEAVLDETLCTISGWGHTQNILQSREKLRAAYVPTVKQETCNLAYNTFGGLTDTMICAGYMKGRIDSCQGLFLN